MDGLRSRREKCIESLAPWAPAPRPFPSLCKWARKELAAAGTKAGWGAPFTQPAHWTCPTAVSQRLAARGQWCSPLACAFPWIFVLSPPRECCQGPCPLQLFPQAGLRTWPTAPCASRSDCCPMRKARNCEYPWWSAPEPALGGVRFGRD